MTTPAPKRREQRRTHLDASVVPVEAALVARAGEIGSDYAAARKAARAHGVQSDMAEVIADAMAGMVAAEFRALAEELHWRLSGSRCRTPAATSWSSTLTRSCR